ncbi:MAG TPA: hypothetical protein DIW31_11080 [Bacteroidales bacterium]|nr:hypothetical protein [Bacteroidales bacterium]
MKSKISKFDVIFQQYLLANLSMFKIVFSLLLLIQSSLSAQIDSLPKANKSKGSFAKQLILPTSLGIAGIIVKETNFREYFQEKVQSSRLKTNTKVDDYIQYVPIVELHAADIYYSKPINEIFQNSKNLIIAELFTALIVQSIKHTVNIKRPDGHDYSFFSGHTSQSFTGATALYIEYGETNRLYALSGYGFSTATGILRITNNRHWLSDVLVGAGIGIFSARLIWYINPFPNWKPFKDKKVAIYPYVNGLSNNAGFRVIF